jgi:hypothetical protein
LPCPQLAGFQLSTEEQAEHGVSRDIVEVVETVRSLFVDEALGVRIARVGAVLKLDKVSAWRRVRRAIDRGFLKNDEERKGRPARLALADPLPKDLELLPAPEKLPGAVSGLQVSPEGMDSGPSPAVRGGRRPRRPARRRGGDRT